MVYVVRSMLVIFAVVLAVACGSPSGPPAVDGDASTFSGTVREVLPAGRYTYLRVHVADGDERWVVVQGDAQRDHVTVHSYGRRRDFVSSRLGRTFDELYFASLAEAPKGSTP
jgi:hypothetical protein